MKELELFVYERLKELNEESNIKLNENSHSKARLKGQYFELAHLIRKFFLDDYQIMSWKKLLEDKIFNLKESNENNQRN